MKLVNTSLFLQVKVDTSQKSQKNRREHVNQKIHS